MIVKINKLINDIKQININDYKQNCLNCVLFNCRSLKNKLPCLNNFIHNNKIDILFLNETWFTDNFGIGEITYKELYDIYLINRFEKRGGGCAILANKAISSVLVHSESKNDGEYIIIDLLLKIRIRLVCAYRPPNMNKANTILFIKSLLEYYSSNYFIIGDLNFNMINWNDKSFKNIFGEIFLEFCDKYDLHQMVTEPTRGTSLIDLVLTNVPPLIKNIKVGEGLSTSDHNSIYFDINSKFKPSKQKISIRDYNKLDIKTINNKFLYLTPDKFIYMCDLDDKYKSFLGAILYHMDCLIPYKKIELGSQKLQYPDYITNIIKKRQKSGNIIKIIRTLNLHIITLVNTVRK